MREQANATGRGGRPCNSQQNNRQIPSRIVQRHETGARALPRLHLGLIDQSGAWRACGGCSHHKRAWGKNGGWYENWETNGRSIQKGRDGLCRNGAGFIFPREDLIEMFDDGWKRMSNKNKKSAPESAPPPGGCAGGPASSSGRPRRRRWESKGPRVSEAAPSRTPLRAPRTNYLYVTCKITAS